MDHRTLQRRLISPAGFAFVLLLFLLPFVSVSCGSDRPLKATFTGVDMVAGAKPDLSGEVGGGPVDSETERELFALFADDIDVSPTAVLAALAVMAGMATGLIRAKVGRHGGAAVLAIVAATFLTAAVLGARGRVDKALQAKSVLLGGAMPPTTIQARYGFWLALLSLVALAVGNAVMWAQARRDSIETGTRPGEGGGGAGPDRPELLDLDG